MQVLANTGSCVNSVIFFFLFFSSSWSSLHFLLQDDSAMANIALSSCNKAKNNVHIQTVDCVDLFFLQHTVCTDIDVFKKLHQVLG